MSDALFPSDPETTPVRPEHLTEGMIVHARMFFTSQSGRTVNQIFRHRNIYGADEIQIEFTEGPDMWRTVGDTVEVEC